MRIVPFPGHGGVSPEESWLAELEAALNGDGKGAVADSWRELRDDVRALAPPMDPAFEERLREQIAERPVRRGTAAASRLRLRPFGRPAVAALTVACTLVAVTLFIAPWQSTNHVVERLPSATSAAGVPSGKSRTLRAPESSPAAPAVAGAAAQGVALTPGGVVPTPGRVQQLAASLSLTTTPTNVQTTADGVARVAVSDGGFVQSSNVQVQQAGQSEATLMLRLPSARLSTALAALAQLAPVRAESQSLQDITSTYNAARQRLADATAGRQALLRALSQATTEGQIDSLRERLSQASGAIARARSALQSVSQHASTAEVEVTILGDARAGSEGLTLHRGLHDAGRVLVVALVVLLIAAAILVPLALLVFALAIALRAWRRYQRERALGP